MEDKIEREELVDKNELVKEIVDKIINTYNLNDEPTINQFGDIESGYAMINASHLKQLLEEILRYYK